MRYKQIASIKKETIFMKLHRFIGDFNLTADSLFSEEKELVHQLKSVLKIKKGEKIILCDGKGQEASFSVTPQGRGFIFNRESDILSAWMPLNKITLCLSVLKKENFELVVQKATELGVSRIIPVISVRTVKTGLNMTRITKIAKEAAEQSGRGDIPDILPISLFEKCLAIEGNKIILHPALKNKKDPILNTNASTKIIFIGPEGGWTNEEILTAKQAGASCVSFGPMIMRSETAAIIASFAFSQLLNNY